VAGGAVDGAEGQGKQQGKGRGADPGELPPPGEGQVQGSRQGQQQHGGVDQAEQQFAQADPGHGGRGTGAPVDHGLEIVRIVIWKEILTLVQSMTATQSMMGASIKETTTGRPLNEYHVRITWINSNITMGQIDCRDSCCSWGSGTCTDLSASSKERLGAYLKRISVGSCSAILGLYHPEQRYVGSRGLRVNFQIKSLAAHQKLSEN
jgi:hypothetical protein